MVSSLLLPRRSGGADISIIDQQLGQMYELMQAIRKSQVEDANAEVKDKEGEHQ